ncbi:MAG: ferrochelatase [Deltaproteobacteria bacterium]|nr:ferrochelatase [Deltaproteobacteria bacterium]
MSTATQKTAVLYLAFGGADSVENCEPFIKNVLKGRPVTPEMVAKIRERYTLIGGHSPLLDITRAQAKAVDAALRAQGFEYPWYVGMRYWHPFIKDTLTQMKADGIERAIGVIMTPFNTIATASGYHIDVETVEEELGGTLRVEFAREWHQHPSFLKAVTSNMQAELNTFADLKDVLVIFSIHSLPVTLLEGDPYEMQIYQTAEKLMAKIPADWKIGYQSKGGGPREWMGPATEEVIDLAVKTGKKGVVVVPLGFAADHVETLYDIDILFKNYAEAKGLVFRRSASLNTNELMIKTLVDIVARHTWQVKRFF